MKWFNYSDARSRAAIPFVVTSGYRTEAHNFEVGGTQNSSHMKGCAADIACRGSRDRFIIVTALLEAGFDRIGIGDGFVHCDTDWEKPSYVIFTYN
jgi:uncharacterized protein YcbK (DUF882 family)